MSSIGYRQIGQFLTGELSLDSAIQKMKTDTHRYIRQQYNWFRLSDEKIHWFDITEQDNDEIAGIVDSYLCNN
jgi:tRNA dimethylallyltransferase